MSTATPNPDDFDRAAEIVAAQLADAGDDRSIEAALDALDAMRVRAAALGVDHAALAAAFDRALGPEPAADVALELSRRSGQTFGQILARLNAVMEGNVRALRLLGVRTTPEERLRLLGMNREDRYRAALRMIRESFPAD